MVHVANAAGENAPKAQIVSVNMALEDEAVYIVQAKCANVGNVHFELHGEAILQSDRGALIMKQTLDGQAGVMLPMDIRNFGATLDFAGVDPGKYTLTVSMACGDPDTVAQRRMVIEVTGDEQGKMVRILESEALAERGEQAEAAGVTP
jgi:hypothetical protein